MDLKLNDKTAFISGATSGIGYATAKVLLKEGMTVYINGRSKKSLEKAIDKLQNEVANAKINGIVESESNGLYTVNHNFPYEGFYLMHIEFQKRKVIRKIIKKCD